MVEHAVVGAGGIEMGADGGAPGAHGLGRIGIVAIIILPSELAVALAVDTNAWKEIASFVAALYYIMIIMTVSNASTLTK